MLSVIKYCICSSPQLQPEEGAVAITPQGFHCACGVLIISTVVALKPQYYDSSVLQNVN